MIARAEDNGQTAGYGAAQPAGCSGVLERACEEEGPARLPRA